MRRCLEVSKFINTSPWSWAPVPFKMKTRILHLYVYTPLSDVFRDVFSKFTANFFLNVWLLDIYPDENTLIVWFVHIHIGIRTHVCLVASVSTWTKYPRRQPKGLPYFAFYWCDKLGDGDGRVYFILHFCLTFPGGAKVATPAGQEPNIWT